MSANTVTFVVKLWFMISEETRKFCTVWLSWLRIARKGAILAPPSTPSAGAGIEESPKESVLILLAQTTLIAFAPLPSSMPALTAANLPIIEVARSVMKASSSAGVASSARSAGVNSSGSTSPPALAASSTMAVSLVFSPAALTSSRFFGVPCPFSVIVPATLPSGVLTFSVAVKAPTPVGSNISVFGSWVFEKCVVSATSSVGIAGPLLCWIGRRRQMPAAPSLIVSGISRTPSLCGPTRSVRLPSAASR